MGLERHVGHETGEGLEAPEKKGLRALFLFAWGRAYGKVGIPMGLAGLMAICLWQVGVGGWKLAEAMALVAVSYALGLLGRDVRMRQQVAKRTAALVASNLEREKLIVRLQQTEDALRESEERYRGLFENVPIGIYRTTPDGKIVMANKKMLDLLAYSSLEELKERNLETDGSEAGYHRDKFKERLIQEGEIRGLEAEWTRRDGTKLIVFENTRVVRQSDGSVAYFEGTLEDITVRKRMEEAVRRSEVQYRGLFENANEPILIFEPQLETILAANQKACETYGFERAELVGRSLKTLTLDVGRGEKRLEELLREGNYDAFETVHLNRQGERIDILSSFATVEYEGRPAILSLNRNLTEQKKVEKQLREQATFLNGLILNTPIGIVVLDREHRVKMCNSSFEAIFGHRQEEILGANIDDLIAPESMEQHAKGLTQRGIGGEIVHAHAPRKKKDGSLVEVEIYGVPLIVDGALVGAYGLYQDITSRKQAEAALRQANETLKSTVAELERHAQEMDLLIDLGELLHACSNEEEAFAAIREAGQKLFPGVSGALCVREEEGRLMEVKVEWGDRPPSNVAFSPVDCIALRLGHVHSARGAKATLACRHLKQAAWEPMCVPMLAQGEPLGVLCLEGSQHEKNLEQTRPEAREHTERLAATVAEQIGLALVNLQLRQRLKAHQAGENPRPTCNVQ